MTPLHVFMVFVYPACTCVLIWQVPAAACPLLLLYATAVPLALALPCLPRPNACRKGCCEHSVHVCAGFESPRLSPEGHGCEHSWVHCKCTHTYL